MTVENYMLCTKVKLQTQNVNKNEVRNWYVVLRDTVGTKAPVSNKTE